MASMSKSRTIAAILGMLEGRERDAHRQLLALQERLESGRQDKSGADAFLNGATSAWAEAKNASELARRIAAGQAL